MGIAAFFTTVASINCQASTSQKHSTLENVNFIWGNILTLTIEIAKKGLCDVLIPGVLLRGKMPCDKTYIPLKKHRHALWTPQPPNVNKEMQRLCTLFLFRCASNSHCGYHSYKEAVARVSQIQPPAHHIWYSSNWNVMHHCQVRSSWGFVILDGSSACDAFENLIKNDLKEFEFISNTLSGCAACDTQMFGMMPQIFKRK